VQFECGPRCILLDPLREKRDLRTGYVTGTIAGAIVSLNDILAKVNVNFIADPWEWGDLVPNPIPGNEPWDRAYRDFKTRLHWLLLWSDQVQVVDSFVLFNRQFEQWFREAQASHSAALEDIQTPTVSKPIGTPERKKAFLDLCYERLPYALPGAKARAQLEARANNFSESLIAELAGEEEPVRRRIK
jgi:hypothetical protein